MRSSLLAATCSLLLLGIVTVGCIVRVTRADDDPLPNGAITGAPADCRGGPKEGPAHDGVEPAAPRFVGRWDLTNPAQARFQWPGTEVQARFEGTSIHAELKIPIVYLTVNENNCQNRINDYGKEHGNDGTDVKTKNPDGTETTTRQPGNEGTRALCSPFSPLAKDVCQVGDDNQKKKCETDHRDCCKAVTTRFTVKIDDRPEIQVPVSQSISDYTLAENLPPGPHTVTLHRGVETPAGIFEFRGFTVPNGKLLPPRVRDRRILVIGDSITSAYGITGKNAQCHFSYDTQNTFNSYSFLTGRALDADVELVSISGRGMWRNNTGAFEGLMPLLFDRAIPSRLQATNKSWPPVPEGAARPAPTEIAVTDEKTRAEDLADDDLIVRHDFTKASKPHVVVINLGTNDFFIGVPPNDLFERQYLQFVRDLREKYGFTDAHIILAVPPMISDAPDDQPRSAIRGILQRVVRATGDARVYMMEFLDQGVRRGMGCDFHPNLATHAIMAEQLTGAIRTKTCW